MKNEATKSISEVKVEEVIKVYSGKPGCGCGCMGNYRVNPQHFELAGKIRGYEYEANEANLTQVKKVLLNVHKAFEQPAMANFVSSEHLKSYTTTEGFEVPAVNIYALETSKRYYWVYAKA